MDIAKQLMKCVARAFYETKHILVLDALMVHHAVRDDELAKLLALQTKDLHKLCGKLTEDRLLAVYSRLEQREGQSRPVNRTWYFLDYRAAIDAIKWRMKKTVDEVEVKMNKDADVKDYVCPRCRNKVGILDAVNTVDEFGLFHCDRCETVLIEDEDDAPDKATQERLSRFMHQTTMIVDLLKKVDEVVVPENDFESALSIAVPVPQDKTQLSKQFIPVDRPTKKGVTSSAPQALAVSITDSSEKTAAEIAADQARKQQQAEKNSLPVWHTQSTVDPNAVTSAGVKEAVERAARERDVAIALKQEEAVTEEDAIDSNEAAIAAFYREQEENLRLTEEEDDSDDEDEDEEFEDLDVGTNMNSAVASSTATPAGSGKLTIPTIGPATATGESEEDDEDGRSAKKIKAESPEDSEEDMEFEDV